MVKQFTLITLLMTQTFSQSEERGNPNYRRGTNIDVNKVRATVYNFGIIGRTGTIPGGVPFEWPVNSGKEYIAMGALIVGAEVITEEEESRPLVTIPFRSDQNGNSMTWEPVAEYLNSNSKEVTISDDPSTWPDSWPDKADDENDPGWPGSWNGYFGKNQFNAQQEIFYKVSDDMNYLSGYTYHPDTTDMSRLGAGLLTGVRVMEWKQILIEDVVFILHEVTNDGSYDYDKVAFSLWLADLVGGDGDSGDDTPDFRIINDVAWSMDSDGIGNPAFGTDPVGVAATSFIETPGNNVDRIDNDGDGEPNGPIISETMILDEILGNAIDDNGNGLIDENMAHVPFGDQSGVSFADKIDNNGNAEENSPIITQEMIDAAFSTDWNIWPDPDDNFQDSIIHVAGLDANDIGLAFADGIDNNASPDNPYILEYPVGLGAEVNSPLVTSEMVATAANDTWQRYKVPGTEIILYSLDQDDIGKPYRDGIDNDDDGAIDEGIDEGIDEMIDESRDDFIDNDGDWAIDDDVGINGDKSGGIEAGVDDQKPTSGSGSGFPGEPNIDKTDVSESDQMGLTSVGYDPAGSIPITSDAYLWSFYMSPGDFWQPPETGQPPGDYDLFVTSGFFPLKKGQTERIAMAVTLGNDEADALRNKEVAETTYEYDYQFAKAPNPPKVRAVPGDGRITLYWDDSAEESEDRYMNEITNGIVNKDFEGYKIYRATDTEFEDALTITDGDGNPTFFEPYTQNGNRAQWDLVNGKYGWHPVSLNGVQFYLGDETGLQHSYVDEDVVNGQTYYYAVVSYDYGGDENNEIIPSDSPMRLRVNTVTNKIVLGPNVVKAIPSPPAAGYSIANIIDDQVKHIRGTTSGKIFYEIIDPQKVKQGHTYQITFEDTVFANQQGLSGYDTVYTKSFTLVDITNTVSPDTLIDNEKNLPIEDGKIIDGIRLRFENVPSLEFNAEKSYWSNDSIWSIRSDWFALFDAIGTKMPYDYRIIFTDQQNTESLEFCIRYVGNTTNCFPGFLYPSKNVNFFIQRRIGLSGVDENDWEDIPFAFIDVIPYGNPDGYFNADGDRESDWIVFMDDTTENGEQNPSWYFALNLHKNDSLLTIDQPRPGDTAYVIIEKPFLNEDVFEFSTESSTISKEKALSDMDKIKVVPNPYFGASAFEEKNNYVNGRGPREIQFRYLPSECTIRIFNIAGELVSEIHHSEPINFGTGSWDLLTKDNLNASYGMYIYHVSAPGIGEKVGKFAIIK